MGMRTRVLQSKWLWGAVGAVGILVLAGVVYVGVAAWQGREERRREREVSERVREMILGENTKAGKGKKEGSGDGGASSVTLSGGAAGSVKPRRVVAPDATKRQRVDFMERVRELDTRISPADMPPQFRRLMSGPLQGYLPLEKLSGGDLSKADTGSAAPRERLLRWGQYAIESNLLSQENGDVQASWRRSMEGYLDAVEHFLLQEEWTLSGPAPQESPPPWFAKAAWLTAARAALRGEREKAADLFERYLEAVRILHFRLFPWCSLPDETETAIAVLGTMAEFPDEGLARAERVLEQMRASREQVKDLQTAYTRQFKRTVLQEDAMRPYSFFWRSLSLGKVSPEMAVRRLLWPVWSREFDRWEAARRQGNEGETNAARGRLRAVLGVMNMQDAWENGETFLGGYEDHARNGNEWFDRAANRARLALAAARFRREAGRYPETIRELIPRYVKADFPGLREGKWGVYAVPRFVCGDAAGLGENDPFWLAVQEVRKRKYQEWWRPNRTDVITLGDLQPYAKGPEEAQAFASRLRRTDEGVMVCSFEASPGSIRMVGDSRKGAELHLTAHYRIAGATAGREEVRMVIGEGKAKVKTINAK